MTNQPVDIVIGGIFALAALVVGALLDFLKREPKYRYNVCSRADSYRMFYWFLGLTAGEWILIFLMQYELLIREIGWPLFLLLFAAKMVLYQKDYVRRRPDVPNLMFRAAQYEFLAASLVLVGISYWVHSRGA